MHRPRVFALYLEGRSLIAIAKQAPVGRRSASTGANAAPTPGMGLWDDPGFLHNEKYIGVWRFKQCQWVKVPGENRRVPRARDAVDVLEQLRPELRIIDPDTWRDTQARLAGNGALGACPPDHGQWLPPRDLVWVCAE